MSRINMSEEPLRVERNAHAMGSTYSLVLYGSDLAEMESAVDAAFEEVWRLEQVLSAYLPASKWSELNRHAYHRAVKVPPELFWLLARCQEFSRLSEGAFDISVGPLIKAWGFFNGGGRRPGEAELRAARADVGYQYIHLDPASQTVRFERPNLEINAGGIGKGYAVDRMVEILRRRGFRSALVVGSGSSIYGLGAPPGEPRGWHIEIQDPRDRRRPAARVFLENLSISTSGGSEKSFWDGGRTFCHIIDPRTAHPVQGTSLVSVIAPQALDSEAWTKPFLIHGRQWAARHKPQGFRVFLLDERMEHEGVWLE